MAEIALGRRPGSKYFGLVAVVDDEDLGRVTLHTWWAKPAQDTFYVEGIVDGHRVYLHRFITGAKPSQVVDHVNHNGLDNRRDNLRVTTQVGNSENQRPKHGGSSKYKGVYLCKETGRWSAQIKVNYKAKRLGRFDTEIDAALAYDTAARELFGEYAVLNFP